MALSDSHGGDERSNMAGIHYWNRPVASGYVAAGSSGYAAEAAPPRAARLPSQPHINPQYQRPPRSEPQLQRFAAMPRFKPQATHVSQNETTCLNSGIVQPTRFVRPRSSIGGGQCYIARPFMMHAAANGQVKFEPAATLRCQMVPSVETWVQTIVRPAARKLLGSDLVELSVAGSYGCRSRNHVAGSRLSEHGKANALDISKFVLADGRVITVKQNWHGSGRERAFLRYVHRGACEHFSTVLGPNADRYHRDHFHLDLASHGRDGMYRVCK